MPAKIRTIKANRIYNGEVFDFNKSIDYKGETLGELRLKEKKSGVFIAKVFQDLNGDGEIARSDLIFKGKINNVVDPDILTYFVGSIKLKKQMHSCEWNLQKQLKNSGNDLIACTMDYVPTVYELTLHSDASDEKFLFGGIGSFKSEEPFYENEPELPAGTIAIPDRGFDPVTPFPQEPKIDPRDLKTKLFWDPKDPPRRIEEVFNVIRPGDDNGQDGIIYGTTEADYIFGTNNDDAIWGLEGMDVIRGLDGDDELRGQRLRFAVGGQTGDDTVFGGAGNDQIWASKAYGGPGDDTFEPQEIGGVEFSGGSGDDDLKGVKGKDILIGGPGDDTLDGGLSKDRLTGGPGADHFVIGHRTINNQYEKDTINDFKDIGDFIELQPLTLGTQNIEFDYQLSRGGKLTISVQTPYFNGVIADVYGLDRNRDLWEQVELNRMTLEIIA